MWGELDSRFHVKFGMRSHVSMEYCETDSRFRVFEIKWASMRDLPGHWAREAGVFQLFAEKVTNYIYFSKRVKKLYELG